MDYRFLADLKAETTIPDSGIASQVLQKGDSVNVTLFSMAAGEGLPSHAVPTPVILCFLEGEAEVQLGGDTVQAGPGSFVYMPPNLPHAISVKSALKMLLVQIKCGYSK
jgi:quercetin dioxygenase-like cupin family protein